MFHVEHSPVELGPARLGAFLHFPEGCRIQQAQGQAMRDISQIDVRTPIQPELGLPIDAALDARAPTFGKGHKHGALAGAVIDQPADTTRTKGSTQTQQMQGFQHGCLAGTVLADEKVELGVGEERDRLEITNIRNLQSGDGHQERRPDYRRIGMTT